MFEWLDMNAWGWWVFAVLLLVIEILAPGTFFLWLGVSAGLVGVIAYLLPDLHVAWELLLFALFSVISVTAFRFYQKRNPTPTDQPALNLRGKQYLGRIITVTQAIENGRGKAKLDDTHWNIEGPDCPKGTRVKVIAVEGLLLKVDLYKPT